MEYFEIKETMIRDLANMFMNAFNAPPWNDKWTEEAAGKRIRQMVTGENAYGIAGYLDGKLCGMIVGREEQYYDCVHFEIKEFCMDVSMKSKGLGSLLLKEFESRLKEKGIDKTILWTSRDPRTEGYYQKKGYETNEFLTVMEKRISGTL